MNQIVTVYKRTKKKKVNGKDVKSTVLYVRFHGVDKNSQVNATMSTNVLKALLKDYSPRKINSMTEAKEMGRKALKAGLIKDKDGNVLGEDGYPIPKAVQEKNEQEKKKAETKLIPYCLEYWTWDSEYLKKNETLGKHRTKDTAKRAYGRLAKWLPLYFDPDFDVKDMSTATFLLADVTSSDINNWRDMMIENGLESGSVRNAICNLKNALEQALKDGLIDRSVVDGIENVSIRKKNDEEDRTGIPTEEEVQNVLTWLNENYPVGSPERWRYLTVAIGAYGGARIGEVCSLKGECVIVGNDYYTLRIKYNWAAYTGLKKPKANKERTTFIPFGLGGELSEITTPDGWLFPSIYGKDRPVGDNTIRNNFYSALEAIGISEEERAERNLKFHSLRHYANTWMLQHGINPDDVQRAIGHSSKGMQEYYYHDTEKHNRETALKLNQLNKEASK